MSEPKKIIDGLVTPKTVYEILNNPGSKPAAGYTSPTQVIKNPETYPGFEYTWNGDKLIDVYNFAEDIDKYGTTVNQDYEENGFFGASNANTGDIVMNGDQMQREGMFWNSNINKLGDFNSLAEAQKANPTAYSKSTQLDFEKSQELNKGAGVLDYTKIGLAGAQLGLGYLSYKDNKKTAGIQRDLLREQLANAKEVKAQRNHVIADLSGAFGGGGLAASSVKEPNTSITTASGNTTTQPLTIATTGTKKRSRNSVIGIRG